MRMRFILSLCLSILLFYFYIHHPAYAKEKLIKYLPRDEAMDMVTGSNLPITVYESTCPKLEGISRELELCNRCVSEWKPKCPDCCLTKEHDKRFIHCTPQEDSKYDCTPPGFSVNDCNRVDCAQYEPDCTNPNAIPSCQRKGCPDSTPNGTCSVDKGGWICSEQNLKPVFTGCNPNSASGLKKCSLPYYNVTPVPVYDNNKPPKIIGYKYRYDLTASYSQCIDDCLQYTDKYEKCVNGVYCCKKKVCGQQGYDNACDQSTCEKLVANPKCDDYTAGDCIKLQAQLSNCLRAGVNGDCYSCFKEIDPQLLYKFVARSREKIVVAWQIIVSPLNAGNSSVYFYTMVKVFDDVTGNPVHESFVSQKSLTGSFTIFSATAVDKKEVIAGKEEYVLEPGHSYTIRPYYFIPPVGQGLSARIDQVQLIIIRTRE